ncbi:MAG: MBL fold metallo-hydrolase [Bacteroidetes bacterium]|nr:MBL fold metallo-hydrolase [Bacteroidota bacterium]
MKIWKTSQGYKVIRVIAGRSNVFLLTDGKNNILIDTGPGFMWKTLEMRLKQSGVNTIDYLILTHTHYDHAENAWRIREKYKAKVIVHRSEAEYLASGDNILPQGTNWFSRLLVRIFIKKFNSFARYTPCSYDLLIDSFYDLKDPGFNAYILHTPGHTPGSLSVIIGHEIALVGDTMFGIFRGSVFPPFANDVRSLVKSWGDLLETGCNIFLPSHGSENSRELVLKEYNKRLTSI